jgi:hypothetical protein
MFLKIRSQILEDYDKYVVVPEENFKRYIGLRTANDIISFKINDPLEERLMPYFMRLGEKQYALRALDEFYYIEGGFFIIRHHGIEMYCHQDITEFRIGDRNNFHPIENMLYYYWCFFDLDNTKFRSIGSFELHFAITTEEEIANMRLIEKHLI